MRIEDCVIAKVWLSQDPTEERVVPKSDRLVYELATKATLTRLLQKGWVQFFFVKKTTGQETSIIATLNRNLYNYTFKGKKPPVRGLVRFVCFNRKGKTGVWRSAYAMRVTQIIEENKNQANGRAGKNRKVDVNSNTSTVIDWDYDAGKPL